MCTNIFILVSTLCHELIGDGLQQLWLVFLGADKVSLAGGSRLWREGILGQFTLTDNIFTTLFFVGLKFTDYEDIVSGNLPQLKNCKHSKF